MDSGTTAPDTVADLDLVVPRVRPYPNPERPLAISGITFGDGVSFASPIYDKLETNIPHSLMNYIGRPFPTGAALFPDHRVVRDYLHD